MSSGWQTTRKSRTHSGQKRGSDAFADDWGSYENSRSSSRSAVIGGWSGPQGPNQTRRHAHGLSNNNMGIPYKQPTSTSHAKPPYSSTGSFRQCPNMPPTTTAQGNNDVIDPVKYGPSMQNPKPMVTVPDDGSLNTEQRLVVESVLSGYSTFFTGPAGTGKSHVLSSILKLNEEGEIAPKRRIVITATTGIAACNVGGITIHSFAGAGTGEGPLPNMVSKVMSNEYTKQRWKECDVLVIDEVSMMPASFLDNLEFIARRARNDQRTFGGIQLVMCGDFFQLPPVNLAKNSFAFEAKCWPKVLKSSILLKQIFRQNGDPVLMEILNEARVGELSEKSIQALRVHSLFEQNKNKQVGAGPTPAEIKPTLLECKNRQVDNANHKELAKLPGEVHAFDSRDRAMSKSYEAQLNNCRAPQRLELKVGAQVILLKNVDPERGLVNGSRGVIVDFRRHPKSTNDMPREFKRLSLPVVQFDAIGVAGRNSDDQEDEDEDPPLELVEPAEWTTRVGDTIVSSRIQIPLRLAWALSVHKSQGMTIPNLSVSLQGVFEYGQAYVALSRATRLDQLTLRGFNENSFRAHPKVKSYYSFLGGDADEKSKARGKENTNPKETSPVPCMGDSSSTGYCSKITEGQLQRMEQNRQRALAIRKQRQEAAAISVTPDAAD